MGYSRVGGGGGVGHLRPIYLIQNFKGHCVLSLSCFPTLSSPIKGWLSMLFSHGLSHWIDNDITLSTLYALYDNTQ